MMIMIMIMMMMVIIIIVILIIVILIIVIFILIEGSLNSKLPTIWRVEKAEETGSHVKSKKMH